jgi:hypothetical protein
MSKIPALPPDQVIQLANERASPLEKLLYLIEAESRVYPSNGYHVLAHEEGLSPTWPRLKIWREIVRVADTIISGGG